MPTRESPAAISWKPLDAVELERRGRYEPPNPTPTSPTSDIPLLYNENRGTFDVDFQHHVPLGDWNDVTWGLGYRISLDHVKDGLIQFVPNNRAEQLFSLFAQDEIALIKDKLRLTGRVGAKLRTQQLYRV